MVNKGWIWKINVNESDSNTINIKITMNIYLKLISLYTQDRPKSKRNWYTIDPKVKTYQLRCGWYIFFILRIYHIDICIQPEITKAENESIRVD